MITSSQNPQISFKRGFEPNEIGKLLNHDLKNFVEVSHKIGKGEINAKDGAMRQLIGIPTDSFLQSRDYALSMRNGSKVTYTALIAELFKNPAVQGGKPIVQKISPSKLISLKHLDPRAIAEVAFGIGRGEYKLSEVVKSWKKADELSLKRGTRPSKVAKELREHFALLEPNLAKKLVITLKKLLGKERAQKPPSTPRPPASGLPEPFSWSGG